jgi:ABC-type uncharacterized transport system ATPase component
LITHEHDITEYGTRTIAFRDGHIVSDQPNKKRRIATEELAALPPPDIMNGSVPVNDPAKAAR